MNLSHLIEIYLIMMMKNLKCYYVAMLCEYDDELKMKVNVIEIQMDLEVIFVYLLIKKIIILVDEHDDKGRILMVLSILMIIA